MAHNGGGQPATSSRDFLSGGGEMGALMRTMDWSKTKLGSIDQWPQSLRTSVSTCLNSRFAILVWWGPDLIMLYNDAYREIIASKHPSALGNPGRDCWPEIWDTIGPMLDGVMQRGEATWSDDLLLLLARHGYPEECYFTFSYSPISDESGGIGGVFTPVMETTERVIAERRSKTLRDLAAASVKATSEDKMWASAAKILGSNTHDFPFSVLYTLSSDRSYLHPRSWSGILPGDALCQGPKHVGQLDSPILQAVTKALQSREITLVNDLQLQCPKLPHGIWGIPATEAAVVPVMFPDKTVACMLTGLNARKRFDEDYRSFLQTIARQLSSNVVAARAHEEEVKRAKMLADLDRAKTVFFSNVSHELRTPLTLIVGPVEGMLERARPSAVVSLEELQLVHRNSMRLLKLVNTLLDFSRIEAGRVQAQYEATDLSALTADIASAFGSAMEQAGLEYVIECPPLPEPAYVDREMWEKIVLNLISNAFKFTLKGRITVRMASLPGHMELIVEDTGLGIPKEQQSKVFERFHRVEGVRGRTHEGTGIGLALVLELAKLHGGSIGLESEVGKGSKFVVSIPKGSAHLAAENLSSQRMLKSTGVSASAYVDEALSWLPEAGANASSDHAFAADSVQAPHVPTTTGRILLADDNADMRAYVRRLLGEAYEIESVSNGMEALAAIKNRPPDLVVTDVMMPELDGFGLLRELRANENTSTIPVILLSAKAGEDARIEGLQAGADDYMVKPFTARELLARVGAHLALGRMRREASERERSIRAELEICVLERTAELQLANQELRELSSRLQKMRDDERRRIARELHDSAGQLLTALAMNISVVQNETHKLSPEAAKRIEDNASLLEQLSTEIRTMSHLLHPPLLDEIGLSSALEWYVEGFAKRSGIEASLELPEDMGRLPGDMEIAIFRAVQECLTNIHRHSGSRSCSVKVSEDKNHFRVEIRDAGKGIPKDKQPSLTSSSGGVGLRGMQERIRQLGGTLEIKSTNAGTVVMVSLPRPRSTANNSKGVA
jgi:signal transduction histidine kinase